MEDSAALLPAPFLRGLEGDLRALCADAKRHNASVKEVAERVILQLKEADTPAAAAAAADEAAAAFCAACTPPDPPAAAAAAAAHTRVVLRAVSCIHKLLTHRAVSPARLPTVIDALELLGVDSGDDAVTLKVLQALLSLLTVRAYVTAQPKAELARAFSLLFKLRTVRSSSAAGAAAGPLSAISGPKPDEEDGVIEVTAQAAFRQVASDLFAAAASDNAARPAAASAPPLDALPPVVQAAHALFQDMCSVVAGDDLVWLSLGARRIAQVLALEVMDDGLAGNVGLFSAATAPLFSALLSSRLCPGIHELLRSNADRPVLKALFGLAVTVVRNFWRDLVPDSEVLLSCMAKLVDVGGAPRADPPWAALYAMEALRATLREQAGGPILVDLFQAFDMQSGGNRGVVAGVLQAVCRSGVTCARSGHCNLANLPVAPRGNAFKSFSVSTGNRFNLLVAAATGVCLSFCDAVNTAATAGQTSLVAAMMAEATARGVAQQLGCLLLDVPAVSTAGTNSKALPATPTSALDHVIGGLVCVSFAADKAGVDFARTLVVSSLASSATAALSRLAERGAAVPAAGAGTARPPPPAGDERRVTALYSGVFALERMCGERFGAVWREFVDAAQPLDVALQREAAAVADSDASPTPAPPPPAAAPPAPLAAPLACLKPELEAVFTNVSALSWTACNDLVSALVASSRSSLASLAKRTPTDESSASKATSSRAATSEVRIFGIARAESVMAGIFAADPAADGADAMPHGLWQLLTGHLVAVASDSTIPGMRVTAIRSLVRVASCALESKLTHLVSQDKVIAPLTDLLSSTFVDTREGCLDAVYMLLETRGEFLNGSAAWSSIFAILRAASQKQQLDAAGDGDGDGDGAPSEQAGEAMVQRGFRAVQLIADDFLSFLAFETLSQWVSVLGLYCQQGEDVNVALTAVVLLWRTADHFAKHCGEGVYDSLWMELFGVLKAVGRDGRPEVRNGAVKTLTSTLTAHGTMLTAAAWRGCVERALLPLLEEVMDGGGSEARDAAGSSRTKADAQLVLHHSRDTPRKQWNETRVLALGGVANVLRKAMPKLASLRDEQGRPLLLLLAGGGSEALWAKMLRAAGSAASSKEREVALAGVAALLELLSASGSIVPGADEASGAIALWEAVWTAIDEAVSSGEAPAAGAATISNAKALVTLATGLGGAREDLAACFTPKSSVSCIRILARLVCGGASDGDSGSGSGGGVTDVQRTAVAVIEGQSFGDDTHTWTALVEELLAIVRRRAGSDSGPLVFRVVRLIQSLYVENRLPPAVKAGELEGVVATLGAAMHRRHRQDVSSASSPAHVYGRYASSDEGSQVTSPLPPTVNGVGGVQDTAAAREQELWVVAVNALTAVLVSGLEAGSPNARLWPTLQHVASDFLYASGQGEFHVVPVDPRALEELAHAETYEVRVAVCVRDALGLMTGSVDKAVQRALVDVLARGAQEGVRGGRPRFVRACQSCMFVLADSQWSAVVAADATTARKNIADQAAACVVHVSDSVLGRFVADGQRAGKCPLPAERRAEAVFLLRRLQALRLRSDGDDDARRHLRTLHPRLCECVDKGGDDAVRLLAAATIQAAS
jgi:hypothetical protein